MTHFKDWSQRERRITGLFIVVFAAVMVTMFVSTILHEPEAPIIVNGSDDGTEFEHVRWFELRDTILTSGSETYRFAGIIDEYFGGTLVISARTTIYYSTEYLYVSLGYSTGVTFELDGTQFTILSYDSKATRVRIGWN